MQELSIIIPTYNRVAPLRACLESLCQQTQAANDFEVVVVMDGSTDGSRELLAQLATPFELRAFWHENCKQAATRNRGTQEARGRYCLFLDDDMVASPQLVAEHLRVQRAYAERGGVVGIGYILNKLTGQPPPFVQDFDKVWRGHYEKLNQALKAPTFSDAYSGNLSAPREAILRTGGFTSELPTSEDIDFGYKLQRLGLPFVYLPAAASEQAYAKGANSLLKQFEAEGQANVIMYRRYPELLPHLGLGNFFDLTLRGRWLRRLLFALRCPWSWLVLAGAWLPASPWRHHWHRFVVSYTYWWGVHGAVDQETWEQLTHGTIILMYHAFGADDEPPSRYIVPRRRFAQQITWLKRLHYNIISLEDYLRCRLEYRLPPPRSLVITIDDGYADNRTIAHPILRQYGFPATIFLVSQALGTCNEWDRHLHNELSGRPLLALTDILTMQQEGMRFGAHTRTHQALTTLSESEQRAALEGSRADLESALGVPILTLTYPYGKYDATSRTLAEQAGFLGACGVRLGKNYATTPLHELQRLEIYGTYTLWQFVLALWLGATRLWPWLRKKFGA